MYIIKFAGDYVDTVESCESLNEVAKYLNTYNPKSYTVFRTSPLEATEEQELDSIISLLISKSIEWGRLLDEQSRLSEQIGQKQATIRKKRLLVEDLRYDQDSRAKRWKQIQDLEQEVIDLQAKYDELQQCRENLK